MKTNLFLIFLFIIPMLQISAMEPPEEAKAPAEKSVPTLLHQATKALAHSKNQPQHVFKSDILPSDLQEKVYQSYLAEYARHRIQNVEDLENKEIVPEGLKEEIVKIKRQQIVDELNKQFSLKLSTPRYREGLREDILATFGLKAIRLDPNYQSSGHANINLRGKLKKWDVKKLDQLIQKLRFLPYKHMVDFSQNQLTELPSSIWTLQDNTLNTLDLSDNLIKDLPPVKGKGPKISLLNLQDNQIFHLHPDLGKLVQNDPFTEIHINGNRIQEIPFSLMPKNPMRSTAPLLGTTIDYHTQSYNRPPEPIRYQGTVMAQDFDSKFRLAVGPRGPGQNLENQCTFHHPKEPKLFSAIKLLVNGPLTQEQLKTLDPHTRENLKKHEDSMLSCDREGCRRRYHAYMNPYYQASKSKDYYMRYLKGTALRKEALDVWITRHYCSHNCRKMDQAEGK